MDYYLLDFSHEEMDKAFHVYVFMQDEEHTDFLKYQDKLCLNYTIDNVYVTEEVELQLCGYKRVSESTYYELHKFIEDLSFANNIAHQMTQLWIADGCK